MIVPKKILSFALIILGFLAILTLVQPSGTRKTIEKQSSEIVQKNKKVEIFPETKVASEPVQNIPREKANIKKLAPVSDASTTRIFNEIVSLAINSNSIQTASQPEIKPFYPEQKEIDPQSIAGLVCQFRYSFTNPVSQKLEKGEVVLTK